MTKRRLRITVLDLVGKGPGQRAFQRMMNANRAGIMPQAVAVWCEELGHAVQYACATGFDDLMAALDAECDLLFVAAHSRSAQVAYAVSNLFRRSGTVTVLGGPHACCYPEDAVRYFDYVLGFTDKALIDELLRSAESHRREGVWLSARQQPSVLPPLEQRWKFVAATLEKAPFVKFVPMLSGDDAAEESPLSAAQIRGDLKFLLEKVEKPIVAWHDSNFAVRFHDTMTAIEEGVPQGRMRFLAGGNLSVLASPNLERMQRNGFVGVLPEIAPWPAAANSDHVREIAAQANTILRYIPYVQANFTLGCDSDANEAPFDRTKEFIDLAPGVYPAFALLTAYGAAAPRNLDFQRAGRVVPVPFHFLDGSHAINVRPLNYSWDAFYANVEYLTGYAEAPARLAKRFFANRGWPTRLISLARTATSRRAKFHGKMRRSLIDDQELRAFFDGRSTELPAFYRNRLQRQLGPLWEALPEGALMHDPNAYLKRSEGRPLTARGAAE